MLVALGVPLVAVVGAAIVVNHFYPADLNTPLHQPFVWGLLVAWFGFWLALDAYRLVGGHKGRATATPKGESEGESVANVVTPPTANGEVVR